MPGGRRDLATVAAAKALVARGIADLAKKDQLDRALQSLLDEGKKADYLTYRQVSEYVGASVFRIEPDGPVKVLPDDNVNRDKLDRLLAVLEEQDIELIDETEAPELDCDDAHSYFNRGNAWFDKGEYQKAIGDYDAAIDLDPKYAVALSERYEWLQRVVNVLPELWND